MRATGKTFRAVLRAVADASDGKVVIFVHPHRHAEYVLSFIEDATRRLHDCVYVRIKGDPEISFRAPGGGSTIGLLRITSMERFQQDILEGRYNGLDKHRLKVVFDDCSALDLDPRAVTWIAVRAHG